MTIRNALRSSALPALDAELLLAHVLGKPRTWILAHDRTELEPAALKRCRAALERRKNGEPLAYITGEKEFFGRPFRVTPSVLIPRPATEGLVELALGFLGKPASKRATLDSGIAGIARRLHSGPWTTLIDIGTGSGCIAITLALEGRNERIIGIDTSKKALEVAEENARRFSVSDRTTFLSADGAEFTGALSEPFVLIANPPYIPAETTLHRSVRDFEPAAALFAGRGGLDFLRPLALAARNNPACKGIVLELKENQVSALEQEWTMDNG